MTETPPGASTGSTAPAGETGMPAALRTLLMMTLVLGLFGTGAELVLLEHFEGVWQYVPLVLLGGGIVAVAWYGLARSPASVLTIRGVMTLCVVSGVLGVWLHYDGNATFELEIDEAMTAWPLFKAAISGATPVLAPGAMTQLGLIGLAWSFRHPALRARGNR